MAVKVLETDNPEVEVIKENGSVKKAGLFEAALSSSISHPNVAHTYMYAVRQAVRRRGWLKGGVLVEGWSAGAVPDERRRNGMGMEQRPCFETISRRTPVLGQAGQAHQTHPSGYAWRSKRPSGRQICTHFHLLAPTRPPPASRVRVAVPAPTSTRSWTAP